MVGIRTSLFVSVVIAVVATSSAQPETQYTRERYDLIVERSPFGADPDIIAEAQKTAKDAAEAAAAAKKLEQGMRLCFLLESEDGDIKAGFQNKKAGKGDPKSVLLMVGESFNGMKLLDIDFPNSSAKLLYQDKEISFSLSKAATPAKNQKKPTTAQKPKPPTRRFGSGFRRRKQPAPKPQPPPEPQLSPEEQARKREEVRENLRQYQMEVIRAGMPPLPIPLTPEMDDQLVEEGVLPPVE